MDGQDEGPRFLQENIEEILDTMADGLFTIDHKGKIIYLE